MGIRTSHFTISKRVVREPAIPTLAAWFGVKPFPFSLVSSNGRVFLIECIFFGYSVVGSSQFATC
jgi:hypothetical protein